MVRKIRVIGIMSLISKAENIRQISYLVKIGVFSCWLSFLSVARTTVNNRKDEGDDVKEMGEFVFGSVKCPFGMYKSN